MDQMLKISGLFTELEALTEVNQDDAHKALPLQNIGAFEDPRFSGIVMNSMYFNCG